MAELSTVLTDIARALQRAGIDYMVIGGMANAIWGVPRSTTDVDLSVACEPGAYRDVVNALGKLIAKLPPNVEAYLENGVLPFLHPSGVPVDLLLSKHPYAELAISRGVDVEVDHVPVKFCTPEDLVLHKIISERDKDRLDVADILRRRRETLDRAYLDPRVHERAVILERPEIEQRYLAAFA
ncbi:MAG: hypothetical protein ACTHQM_22405 [Thermoanaerobaculia bacterium]